MDLLFVYMRNFILQRAENKFFAKEWNYLPLLDAYHMEGVPQIGAQEFFISTSPFGLKSSQLNSRGISENCLCFTKIKILFHRAFVFALLVAYQVRGLLGEREFPYGHKLKNFLKAL